MFVWLELGCLAPVKGASLERILHVQLLGGFQLIWGETALTTVHSPRLQALLAYLILHSDAPQSRQHLAFIFFPDSSESQARTNLRNLFHLLHEALPDADLFLGASTQQLQWRQDAPFTLDVTRFEAALHTAVTIAEWQAAVELYHGDLVPGCYDDWILPERERLRQGFIGALEQLVARHEQAQEYLVARQRAQQLLSTDPLSEETYRTLMRLSALSGDRAGVVRFYNQCVNVLQRELGVAPDAETVGAYQEFLQILAQPQIENHFVQNEKRHDNLPLSLTRLRGRVSDVQAVQELVVNNRLVTLVGAGGVGKTRLALATAQELKQVFPDGVWFVDLAPLSEPTQVTPAIASVLGVRERPGTSLPDVLTEYLGERHLLLLLDNCEHLVQAVGGVAEQLLQSAAELTILATSRESLRVEGEVTWRVASLVVPSDMELQAIRGTADAEQFARLLESPSIQLFADRAAAALPTFALTRENIQAVGQICQRLDGIPLALELGAARVKLLSVQQIGERLNECFQLLTDGSRTVLPRHQTLRGTMGWSYRLLSDKEQIFLRRLAVFVGGFTLEAAEQVVGQSGIAPSEVLDLLSLLQEKSLVEVEPQDDAVRNRLLETVRQYAFEKLVESGELESMRQRHATYYLALAERDLPPDSLDAFRAFAPAELLRFNRMICEQGNLRAALTWAETAPGSLELGMRLLRAMGGFFIHSGNWDEGVKRLKTVLAHPDASEHPSMQARLYYLLGQLHGLQSEYVATEKELAQSLTLFQSIGDGRMIAAVMGRLGWLARERGDARAARRWLEQAVAMNRQLKVMANLAGDLFTLAGVAVMEEDVESAKELLVEAQEICRKVNCSELHKGWILYHLGQVAELEGKFVDAMRLHAESLRIFEGFGAKHIGAVYAHHGMGEAALAQGDATFAKTHLNQAIQLARQLRDRTVIAFCLAGFGGVATLEKEPERAALLWGAALALRQSIGAHSAPSVRATHERLIAQARTQIGDRAFENAWAKGAAMSQDEAIDSALQSG